MDPRRVFAPLNKSIAVVRKRSHVLVYSVSGIYRNLTGNAQTVDVELRLGTSMPRLPRPRGTRAAAVTKAVM